PRAPRPAARSAVSIHAVFIMARGYPRSRARTCPPPRDGHPCTRRLRAGPTFDRPCPGYPRGVTTTSRKELFRFLEDRFACAQVCTECARACATRAGLVDPDGPGNQELVRRKGIMCAEVCDATCRVLSEQSQVD